MLLAAIRAVAVDFDRDVGPIHSDNCYACHGPDASKRQANLRLDVEEEVRRVASELLRRVASGDVSTRMPSYLGHDQLAEGKIAILEDWAEASAPRSAHWAFVPPARPEQPSVTWEEPSAGVTSVRGKTIPLNCRGSPV